MKVILLTDVPKVGNRYDIKELKSGFAQNVLIARGLAILATPKALADLENKKATMNEKKQGEIKTFESLLEALNNKKVLIKVKANEKGHLFKAINSRDVVIAVKDQLGVEIEEKMIVVDHVKEIGTHTVIIKKGKSEGKFEIQIEKS